MPPPCTSDWEAVKTTAVALNSITEAARLHNVPYAAAKMRASREKWPVGQRLGRAVEEAKKTEQAQLAKVSPQSVTTVTKSSDALVTALAEDDKQTRQDLSKATRKAAKTLGDMPGESIVDQAQNMKHVATTASQIHGWDKNKGSEVNLMVNLAILGVPAGDAQYCEKAGAYSQ